MKLLLLSKEHLALARAEAERLHAAQGTLEEDLLFLDVDRVAEGLAFTREAHDVVARIPMEDAASLPAVLAALPYGSFVEPPFLVRGRKWGGTALSEEELAGFVWRGLVQAGKEPSVNLKDPVTAVHFFFRGDEVIVARHTGSNNDRFSDRRAHLRPRNHPTSLSPKLARALVNLAGPPSSITTILDPFCGSGGLLIEAALAGRHVTGIDIDPRQVARAEENLAHYGAAATLSVGDAKRCDRYGTFDAIVTDLPWGQNSTLCDASGTFRSFLDAASRTAKRVILAAEASMTLTLGPWRVVAEFSWYVNGGHTRRLLVLER